MLDFTTKDSCAKVKAECEKPILKENVSYRSNDIKIECNESSHKLYFVPFSDKYLKIRKFTSSDDMLILLAM